MTDHWQLQDAEGHFDELVEKVLHDGPQIVTREGIDTVVIMSAEEYRKLTNPRTSLVDFFRKSPLRGVALDLERRKDL